MAGDSFTKWRERSAMKIQARIMAPRPGIIAVYETPYLSRGWAILLLFAWAPCMIALLVAMFLNESAIKDSVDFATGLMTLIMLLLLASLVFVPMIAASRRKWTLCADRLEIVQRPLVPLLGPYRNVSIPLGEIAAARLGEALNAMPIVELEACGRRYRMAPKHVGKGKTVTLDFAGFDDFVDRIGTAIVAAGFQRPPGERLKTASSGVAGLVILAVIVSLFGLLCLFGMYTLMQGERIGIQALAFGAPLTLLFGSLLRSRWRKSRAGA